MTDRTPDLDALDRRTYLRATGAAALGAAGLAGCVGRATGTLATQVTDQPADIADFESLVVTVDGFWLGPEGAEPEEDADGENETDTDDSLSGMEASEIADSYTVRELRDELRKRDLTVRGKKSTLVERLVKKAGLGKDTDNDDDTSED